MKYDIIIREPQRTDGYDIHRLIAECPPLDTNSCYANLLQATHFFRTSAIARRDGDAVGSVSGYLIPGQTDVLFIWQVAVSEKVRGRGLAVRMIADILNREWCRQVRYLHTTITEDNLPSRSLFKKISCLLGTALREQDFFGRESHFAGTKDSESLFVIGPFDHGDALALQA